MSETLRPETEEITEGVLSTEQLGRIREWQTKIQPGGSVSPGEAYSH
jgi:hypothetical protein